jgi:hypothetical protein
MVVMVVMDMEDMGTEDLGMEDLGTEDLVISVTDTDIMADNVLFTCVEK